MIEVIIWAASVFILWNLTAILVVYSKNWSRDDKRIQSIVNGIESEL